MKRDDFEKKQKDLSSETKHLHENEQCQRKTPFEDGQVKIFRGNKEHRFYPILKKKLLIVDQHLQAHKFLMGEQLTLGDSYLFVILIWLAKLKTNMNEWPNLSRYFMDMKKRKSVQKALYEEDLIGL
jgi:glutathione S-transferase